MEILGKRKESKQHEQNSESQTVDTKVQPKDVVSEIVKNKMVEEASSKTDFNNYDLRVPTAHLKYGD